MTNRLLLNVMSADKTRQKSTKKRSLLGVNEHFEEIFNAVLSSAIVKQQPVKLIFHEQAWEDYLYWQSNDKAMLKRINELIKDIRRSPFEGIGKPERLKHQLGGFWSRRINQEHRLVYTVIDGAVVIAQCRYHY